MARESFYLLVSSEMLAAGLLGQSLLAGLWERKCTAEPASSVGRDAEPSLGWSRRRSRGQGWGTLPTQRPLVECSSLEATANRTAFVLG